MPFDEKQEEGGRVTPVRDSSVEMTAGPVDLMNLFRLAWFGKYFILRFMLVFAAAGVVTVLILPNEYTSDAVYQPAATTDAMSGIGGALPKMGALLGLPFGGTESSYADLSIAMLKSRPFITNFVRTQGIMIPLLAGKSWDRASQRLELDTRVYDPQTTRWRRPRGLPPEPTDDELYDAFEKILSVDHDEKTDFVKVSITFLSPVDAQRWLQALVADLNEQLRQRDIALHERAIDYLTKRLKQNTISDLNPALVDLLKTEIQEEMLANVHRQYALQTVSPPYVPYFKSEPNRALIVSLATLLGGLVGVVTIFVLNALTPYTSPPRLVSFGWLRRRKPGIDNRVLRA
jgi:LPS O-antigen subunit length determinant protein (WzzB/FepE family)